MTAAPGLRLMAVHAHPDDESSKGAAASAHYVSQGVDVRVVSCTGGERGDVLNPQVKDDPRYAGDITAVRRREMAEAAQILGVSHTWLGFVDSGLPEGDPLPPLPEGCFALEPLEVTTEALVREIREFRPHVVTTYDENGGYPHPDHIMTHKVTMAAFEAAGDPNAFPDAGPAWQPLKVYYNGWSPERTERLDAAMKEAGLESPFADWLKNLRTRPRRQLTTHVDCAQHFGTRDDALRAHVTQVDPDGFWFAVPLEIQAQVWPTEDFELAASLVPVNLPEDDVFAGLREIADLDELCRRPARRDGEGRLELFFYPQSALPPLVPDDRYTDGAPRSTRPRDGDGDGVDDMRTEEAHSA